MNGAAQKVYKSLIEVLLEKGLIDQVKYDEIKLRQLKTGESEEEIVKQMRIIN